MFLPRDNGTSQVYILVCHPHFPLWTTQSRERTGIPHRGQGMLPYGIPSTQVFMVSLRMAGTLLQAEFWGNRRLTGLHCQRSKGLFEWFKNERSVILTLSLRERSPRSSKTECCQFCPAAKHRMKSNLGSQAREEKKVSWVEALMGFTTASRCLSWAGLHRRQWDIDDKLISAFWLSKEDRYGTKKCIKSFSKRK